MSDDDDVMMVPVSKTVAPCPATSEEYGAEISRQLMAADVAGQSGDAAAQYTAVHRLGELVAMAEQRGRKLYGALTGYGRTQDKVIITLPGFI